MYILEVTVEDSDIIGANIRSPYCCCVAKALKPLLRKGVSVTVSFSGVTFFKNFLSYSEQNESIDKFHMQIQYGEFLENSECISIRDLHLFEQRTITIKAKILSRFVLNKHLKEDTN